MSDVTGHNHDASGAPTYPDYRDRCPVGCDDLTPVRMADTNVQLVGKDRLVTRRLVPDGPSQFAMTTRNEMLRDALNDVVGKMTWRPDNTAVIHDAEAWRTLVGYIVMATNGDNDGQVPMGVAPDPAPLDARYAAQLNLTIKANSTIEDLREELHAAHEHRRVVEEYMVAQDPAPLDVERLAVVAAARALRERLTIDPGNVVSWGEWDTLDEALAKLGAKP